MVVRGCVDSIYKKHSTTSIIELSKLVVASPDEAITVTHVTRVHFLSTTTCIFNEHSVLPQTSMVINHPLFITLSITCPLQGDISVLPPPSATQKMPIIVPQELLTKVPRRGRRPTKWRHMMYGFVIEHGWARERGCAKFGPATTDHELRSRGGRFTKTLASSCTRVWRRTRLRAATTNNGLVLNGISLAENTSSDAMSLPPREVIDRIKAVLETEEEPSWFKVTC
jgi:hypothetical protein